MPVEPLAVYVVDTGVVPVPGSLAPNNEGDMFNPKDVTGDFLITVTSASVKSGCPVKLFEYVF